MQSVVIKGPKEITVESVDDPEIKDPRSAILKVTSAAICGSDLHPYDGRTPMPDSHTLGHEIMGVIEKVGQGVTSIKEGDRVVLPFNIACGSCFNCARGFTSACLTLNDKNPGAGYGYPSMGPHKGGQAEYVEVPFADFNCIKLPGKPMDEHEDDYLMLADIFPTGYYATELANVQPGSSVAIYGAGPVGLLAAHSALLRGAYQVFVVDMSEVRLAKAKEFGAIPINFKDGDPAEQIMNIRRKDPLLMGSFVPGEEKNIGVDCGIDAVGYQAHSIEDPSKEDPTAVINQLAKLVNATGGVGLIGVYMPQDPGGLDEQAKQGIFPLPLGAMWNKGLTIGMGQTPVKHISIMLRSLINAGKATPGKIVSHHISLADAPEAYRLFDTRGTGEGKEYTKVVINP